MRKLIEITTTATLRPEIFKRTLSSFCEKMFSSYNYDYRMIINVDPIGDSQCMQYDVLKVAEKFFPDIVYNYPKTNNFAKAVKWVWSHTTSDYVFNLEDMWLILTSINLDHLVHIIDSYPKIGTVNLYKYVLSDGAPEPNFYQYNNNKDKRLFLQIRDPLLSPALHRGEFLRSISEEMNDIDNPELQVWGAKKEPNDGMASSGVKKVLNNWDYTLYTGNWVFPFWRCAVPTVDMSQGRRWKKNHGFRKENPFAVWKNKKTLEIKNSCDIM